ncbi:hypothetical protein ACJIZ3_017017 [Penstemon smallii]|uniref:Uncharacterized protein n=1 Tax=Penstemon smallii TaxID=265156 RepID=A0ABD3SUC7_9LAMI
MDPNYSLNSPSLGPAKPAALSRPPRFAKLRKPLTGHRPKLFRPVSERVTEKSGIDPGLSTAKAAFEPVQHFVFTSNTSSNSNSFSEGVMNSDVELVDELRKLKIESENSRNVVGSGNGIGTSSNVHLSGKYFGLRGVDKSDEERSKIVEELRQLKIESENSRNVSSGSGIGTSSNVHFSGKDCSLQGVDESVVSDLHDEMRRLHIENGYFSKVYGENVEGELPNKMKKLNVEAYKADGSRNFVFGRSDGESLNGSLDAMLPNKMKDLKIEECLSSSVNETVDLSSRDKNKFMFGNGGNVKPVDAVGNNCNHFKSEPSSHSGSETMRAMQTENLIDGNSHNVSGPFNPGFTSQAGLQSKNSGIGVSYESESTSTSLPFFASSDICFKQVGGVPGMSSLERADKQVEFSFTSKLGSMATENVFKTPDLKAHVIFGLNRKGETKRESTKDTGLKQKKGRTGRWKKPARVPLKFDRDFGFQENLQTNTESSEQYSPMDVSPCEEMLADNRFSRETSVASEESFSFDDNNSSTEAYPIDSNDLADEGLAYATERLNINECDLKSNKEQGEESSFCVNESILVESPQEDVVSGAETESFKSANDELEFSTDSFITAEDIEVSSSSPIERQDMAGFVQSSFTFASSSADLSGSSASMGIRKKKDQAKVGQDIRSSTPNAKVSHTLSGLPPFEVSGAPPQSSLQGQNVRPQKGEEVKELEAKKDSTAASIAAQESCEKWRLRGNQAYAEGDFLRAEDCYSQGVNLVSRSESSRSCLRVLMLCYSNRAATRMSLRRMREALEDCMKAAALDPNFLKVQVRAASCYLALGDVGNATLHFMKCLQAGSDVSADRKLLVEASEGLEKAQKVAECMKQAAELLARRTSNDINYAVGLIAEALLISSYSEKLLQMKVDALLMLKKYEELIKFCEQLLVSEESNFLMSGSGHSVEFHGSELKRAPSLRVWCWSLILKSYFYLGKLEDALDFIRKQEESVSLMERSGSKSLKSMIPLVATIRDLLHHKAAGNEALLSGNHAEAVEHYTAAISCSVESHPFAAICFCNRAVAYRAMGKVVDALADCSLAIALDGNYLKVFI